MLANRNPDRDKVIRETSLLAIILNSIMAAVKIIIIANINNIFSSLCLLFGKSLSLFMIFNQQLFESYYQRGLLLLYFLSSSGVPF